MNIKNVSRVIGVFWISTSLLWAGLGVVGIYYLSSWLDATQANLEDNLTLVVDSLESVRVLVDGSTDVISSTHQSLTTAQISVHDVSTALADLRPLLWNTTKVVTLDVPDALDGMQDSIPSLIETAKSVDETLTWLSNFNLTIPNPFGSDWTYDLGITYNPNVPLDQAMEDMSQSLEDVPDDLRDLDESLAATDANLIIVSDDLAYLAEDIETLNQQIQAIVPQMEGLAGNIEEIQATFEEAQESVPESFAFAQKIMLAILGLLILTQIPSLYMGGLLFSGVMFHPDPYKDN